MEMHQDRDFLVPLVPGADRRRVGGRMGSATDRMVIDDRKTCQGSLTRIIHERFCCNRPFAAATSLPALWTAGMRECSPLSPSTYCFEYASLPSPTRL
jgi:hypothetical protein